MLFGGSGIHEILKSLSKANLVILLSLYFLLEETDVQSNAFFLFGACQLIITFSHSSKKKNKLYLWSSVVYQIIYFSVTRFLLQLS